MTTPAGTLPLATILATLLLVVAPASAQRTEPPFPPEIPGGRTVVTDTSDEFLKPPATLRYGVDVARTPPTVDFAYFPGQTYPGKPWSNWGDGLAVNGKYYTAIGDHLAPEGNAFVYEYDPERKTFRKLLDVRELLDLPAGHYTPGKIHTRIDLGRDGWLYCATHRGSERVTTDEHHYRGDWILRCHPETGKAEVVAHAPVPRHSIPAGILDPDRLIYYGGTAQGRESDIPGIRFLAYDAAGRQVLYSGPDGPSRYMIFARSTGRLYYTAGKPRETGEAALMRFDPTAEGPPVEVPGHIGLRAATLETPQGIVYTVSQGSRGAESLLYAFHVRTESVEELGPAAVGTQTYVAALAADPAGRYLYYVPGAHGSGDQDGSPVVQFDTKTRRRKVLAFFHPFYGERYGVVPKGTYSVAVDPQGDKIYVTWNASRGSRAWDCCALAVLRIPDSER